MTDKTPVPSATSLGATAAAGARFGVIASLLGLDGAPLAPWIERLGPDLLGGLQVGLGSQLADCALRVRGAAPGPEPDEGFGARLWAAALAVGCPAAAAWCRHALPRAEEAPRAVAAARLAGDRVALSLELAGEDGPAWGVGPLLERLQAGPAPRLRPWALAPLQALAEHLGARVAAVAVEARGADREPCVLRVGLDLRRGAARARLPPVLEAVGVTAAQRSYFANTLDALVPEDGGVRVWLAAEDAGVLAEVGVEHRAVPLALVLPIWRQFHPLPELARRLGALAGAAGAEVAARFELRYARSEPPELALALDLFPG